MSNLSNYRKALVALAGVVGQLITQGVLTGTASTVATIILAGLTAAGVFAVENKAGAVAGDAGHSQLDTVLIVLTLCGVALLLFGVAL